MVSERDSLNEQGSSVVENHEMALERCGALRPDTGGEFLPLGAIGRDEAIGQVGVQDGPAGAHAEET